MNIYKDDSELDTVASRILEKIQDDMYENGTANSLNHLKMIKKEFQALQNEIADRIIRSCYVEMCEDCPIISDSFDQKL